MAIVDQGVVSEDDDLAVTIELLDGHEDIGIICSSLHCEAYMKPRTTSDLGRLRKRGSPVDSVAERIVADGVIEWIICRDQTTVFSEKHSGSHSARQRIHLLTTPASDIVLLSDMKAFLGPERHSIRSGGVLTYRGFDGRTQPGAQVTQQ